MKTPQIDALPGSTPLGVKPPTAKHFVACIENYPTAGKTTEHLIRWDGETVPAALRLPDGTIITKTGRYATKGDRYRFVVCNPLAITPVKSHVVDEENGELRWYA